MVWLVSTCHCHMCSCAQIKCSDLISSAKVSCYSMETIFLASLLPSVRSTFLLFCCLAIVKVFSAAANQKPLVNEDLCIRKSVKPNFNMDMFHEVRRLSSFFNFPAHVPIDPVKLAKCGFYYKNFRDSVECFSCGHRVEYWVHGDDPSSKKWHLNDCLFVDGGISGNISIESFSSILGVKRRIEAYKAQVKRRFRSAVWAVMFSTSHSDSISLSRKQRTIKPQTKCKFRSAVWAVLFSKRCRGMSDLLNRSRNGVARAQSSSRFRSAVLAVIFTRKLT